MQRFLSVIAILTGLLFNSVKVFASIQKEIKTGITYKQYYRKLSGKPAHINVLVVNPSIGNTEIKTGTASANLTGLKKVKDIVNLESAIAGINASYFKRDTGVPIGLTIKNGEMLSGPALNRASIGITDNNSFLIDKVGFQGSITINDSAVYNLFNINQPVFSKIGLSLFNNKYGNSTPKTSHFYKHITIKDRMVKAISAYTSKIPEDGYVIVGPEKLCQNINIGDTVNYDYKLLPENWKDVKQAVSGGPYLVKNGTIFIDKQHFTSSLLWKKEPRTAVGFTKAGNLIFITVDGRYENHSQGATLPELAKLMLDYGAVEAINLDGGSSTQMVINGKIVNKPVVKGGSKVNNALVIKIKEINKDNSTTEASNGKDSQNY